MLAYLAVFVGGSLMGGVGGVLTDPSAKEDNGALLFTAAATSALAAGTYYSCALTNPEILYLELAAFAGYITGFSIIHQGSAISSEKHKQSVPCNTF